MPLKIFKTRSNIPLYKLFRIAIKMRDGIEVPMILVYDVNQYNDRSPWLLMTRGIESSKKDMQFDPLNLSLFQRGFVLAYPLVRGN